MLARERTSAVVYWSDEDRCWIAHSLWMDQIGAGDRIVDALAELIRAMEGVHTLARRMSDQPVEVFRPAPEEVFAMLEEAAVLPREIYEVAHRMAGRFCSRTDQTRPEESICGPL